MQLTDEQLKDVVGGVNTGEFKDGKVYIEFPGIAASFTGYYNCEEIESLVKDFYPYRKLITPQVNNSIREAVKELYKQNSRTIPENVKTTLGM